MRESEIVWNLVWTGGVYEHLRYFAFSLFDQTDSRFRFIANNCTPDSLAAMQAFTAATDRVVETVVHDDPRMVPHGAALEPILRTRNDGEVFAFIDVDIKALAPFTAGFLDTLATASAVTSGSELWTEANTLAEGEVGVGGRHFYDHDGFVYGSPHCALYRRAELLETLDRWGIGLHCGNQTEMPDATWAAVQHAGRDKIAYDTAKVANVLFQVDGHTLVHEENESLLHIGGVSHYLAPPQFDFATDKTDGEFDGEPAWTVHQGIEMRHVLARYTGACLRAAADGESMPEVDGEIDDAAREKLEVVRSEVASMVESARPWIELTGE
ncbi:MAG: hypothetical protein DHS20C19_05300 [Acidimicrobiales bacterium]|nr:MAG: hypothetical protein DHS20C19_05300 [Acidimicrobiales bacterium]